MIAQPPGPRHFVVLTSARPVPYVLEASDRSALLRTTLATCLLGGAVGCGGAGLDPDEPPVTEGEWYRPGVEVTWQWQLTGTPNTSYDVEIYDLDLFETEQDVIDGLHADGRRVLCYFSAGSSEDWRPDYDRFTRADKGYRLDGWAGERWLDIRSENVLAVMNPFLNTALNGLQADDIAGVRDLYGALPAGEFGSVQGRVTKDGRGVYGAHVVAARWIRVLAQTPPQWRRARV